MRLNPLIALAALSLAGSAGAQERELVERGRRDYEIHCSNCHGESGRGDGPMRAVLALPPADLRAIALRNAGVFPFERVYRVIDGREPVKGHGMREMPVWGLSFVEHGSDQPQRDEVRGRILQLIHYLDSIQLTERPQTQPRKKPRR